MHLLNVPENVNIGGHRYILSFKMKLGALRLLQLVCAVGGGWGSMQLYYTEPFFTESTYAGEELLLGKASQHNP